MRINSVSDVVKLIENIITGLINGAGGIITGLMALLVIWFLAHTLWDSIKNPRTKPALNPQLVAAIAAFIWVIK
ncbi:MAG: hypothetical protein GY938_10440 [Ketobacter sp.]|nr:hypothetical protein [Ketobacter sp.]